jgi:hypothetical protein
MDEITLFTAIQPPPPDDSEAVLDGARARLAVTVARTKRAPRRRYPPRLPAATRPRRSSRFHRRSLMLAGCAVAAACAAIILPAVLPAGHSSPFVPSAWAVQPNPDGTVSVFISERTVSHPAQLQHALAAVGVPAQVLFGRACTLDGKVSPQLQRAVLKGPFHTGPYYLKKLPLFDPFEWKIVPAALPPGARLVISELRPVRTATSTGAPFFAILVVRHGQGVTCSTARPDSAG